VQKRRQLARCRRPADPSPRASGQMTQKGRSVAIRCQCWSQPQVSETNSIALQPMHFTTGMCVVLVRKAAKARNEEVWTLLVAIIGRNFWRQCCYCFRSRAPIYSARPLSPSAPRLPLLPSLSSFAVKVHGVKSHCSGTVPPVRPSKHTTIGASLQAARASEALVFERP
jgi:hypothetical protein